MAAGAETRLQKEIQLWLHKTFPDCFVMKIHGNKFQKIGVPDLCVVIDGLSIWIETKVGNNKTSPVQKEVINELNESGAVAFVAYSLDDVKKNFKKNGVKRANRSRWNK